MTNGANILDGLQCALAREAVLTQRCQAWATQHDKVPGLAVIWVGDHPASAVYVTRKRQACERVGIRSFLYDLPSSTTQVELEHLIESLNHRDEVHGILLQLPLPNGLEAGPLLAKIDPAKDVDGFHPLSMGALWQQQRGLRPCTPMGIMALLRWSGVEVKGMEAVVVGASSIVGRPMAAELLNAQATVTVCHRSTRDLESHVRRAELLISATGDRQVIEAAWIRSGAVVVDVGIHRLPSGAVVGDLNTEGVRQKASLFTPVPGGVGPMTIVALMENTLHAFANLHQWPWEPF